MVLKQKFVVVGAGPVGSLAALYAAKRGHDVEIYELRPAWHQCYAATLASRGCLSTCLVQPFPCAARMIHGRGSNGDLYEAAQDYDIHGRTIFAVDRAGLNKRLLDILEDMPNVKFFFSHKLTGADFKKRKAWFEVMTSESATGRAREIEIDFDLMIGADGAHSAVRYHMMKFAQLNYRQDYIGTLWCEFHIKPVKVRSDENPNAVFRISPNHLHIWPGKDFMFIAIPSDDGSFTCTLFLPSAQTLALEKNPASIPEFFDKHFPGVTELIPGRELIESFERNPHLAPSSASNAARLRRRRRLRSRGGPRRVHDEPRARRARRTPINDLALQNYVEMRASVLSPKYRLRKWLEEMMSVYLPGLGWQTKYSRVSFENQRYSEVVAQSEHQGEVLVSVFEALVCSPFIVGAVWLWWKQPKWIARTYQTWTEKAIMAAFERL
ncbi:kynurenine 3-monooxygenase [Verticillium alfalfae VaMs.102]|uniref:Kynurenine 3-monooxygenase n=1 Tax=Verticillium alfalfae (strain VaMs.102 / ATCC MYA-4576 / FGSC 10136) TaxID=526221 RepID=C9SF11_VERA1|nr:kynurenine 3-monooxygenase [Verticillium alfalfae VaMs.102]EEY17797.1 kynurenine 3-monooxygenase [Verticillium alfalfae VaMs.102]